MISADKLLEFSAPDDRYYDFCLWEYQPLSSPEGKYRSVNLLYKSFEVAGVDPGIVEICRAIRDGIGPWRTVWGVKKIADKLSWEFYFYDYKRLNREVSIERMTALLSPYVKCGLDYPGQHPYFMFSIDLDPALIGGAGELDEINVYLGNPGSTVSSGICYSLTAGGLALDNFYFFFDAATELDKAIEKALCSVYLDPVALDTREIFWPELTRCKTVVVANKKFNDGIYFSRVDIGQLIGFLKRMDYPPALVAYAEANRHRLDHMRYDVAFDYVMEQGGIRVLKSSWYGVF
ncbi:hypothetical protein [Methylococcus sp. EFPC2]|uniref:hypothetical protein n=1 Tax=Methylococcus sp. EFPC2 TaxID=2812648 RepID=UPI0019680088|nr:hypothetical protein [Methylococcus sp. EFPC2]QSA98190.1 hypothetical protein JWZ97_05065 [Methylococcus sp. EFPC2]